MFRCALTLFLVLLFTGCDILSPKEDRPMPGALSLEYAHNPDDTSDIFDLGDINNTRSYDFYLTNSGETDLFDVSIASSSDQFLVEPATIRVLRPRGGEAPHQNLKITVLHGTSASGVGPAETLVMGVNEVNLDISAKTITGEGDTLSVDAQAVLRINARLVDVEIFHGGGALDLRAGGSPDRFYNPTGIVWESRVYRVVNGPIRIMNTGNVQLQVRILKQFETSAPPTYRETNVVLEPLEEASIDRGQERIFIRIDGGNTISDFEALPIQQDGLIYIACMPS